MWRAGSVLTLLALATPALAQEPGWHYSPLPGEGDRAALGCNREATAVEFVCLAVRCEDDYAVGLHIHTSRPEGDAGQWQLTIDREFGLAVEAQTSGGPYGARIAGEVAELIETLKNGGLVYLDSADGEVSAQISLSNSLAAISRALFFCAPRVVPEKPAAAPAAN